MLRLVLKKLCNFCTAEAFKSFKLGTWVYTYVVWSPFVCSGFPVLGLHFQLLTKGRPGSPGLGFGTRSRFGSGDESLWVTAGVSALVCVRVSCFPFELQQPRKVPTGAG